MMSAGSQGQHDQQEIIRQQHHEMNISFGMSPHHHQQQQHHHAAPPSSSSSSSMHAAAASFMSNKEASGAYDQLGELDQALFMYLDHGHGGHASSQQHEQRQTLNIFPSQPMHVEPSPKGEISLVLSPAPVGSKMPRSSPDHHHHQQQQHAAAAAMEELAAGSRRQQQQDHHHLHHLQHQQPGFAAEHSAGVGKDVKPVTKKEHKRSLSTGERDPKTLRRLAQNREAARKSRLRKKAYIQQLESSRIRLAQIEQELHSARAQGVFYPGSNLLAEQGLTGKGLGGIDGLSSEAAMFDVEYGRWQEEHSRLMYELRAALQQQLPEGELQMYVESCLAHHDEVLTIKDTVIKGDVFHLISGVWRSPAERCFLWLGGFRPSEVIKMLLGHVEPLTEQQIVGVYGLQQSALETEEALSQGLDALYQSLSDTVIADALGCTPNVANYMGQMGLAIHKLSTLEGFVRQAENLRQQTLHRLHQVLTTRQMARSLLAMADYFHRLRALSSLWVSRARTPPEHHHGGPHN
ncbi:transcription factor TGA2-like [Lolium rigidum]|uniref:transcription factor TGA2-like n=1 Tax=Lolium rigidum TaxID=89674 RepID=UPI001F5C65E7|nr:transcription factor TGA2-like [Lolium rigidum]XP_051188422.1 transcription factor TGA2-like [Lolium perenne]